MSESRFEPAPSNVSKQVADVLNDAFPHLIGCVMDVVFDMKQRKVDGGFLLGRMAKATGLIKYYSEDNMNPQGVDYIMFLDGKTFVALDEDIQIALIRHELQHCLYDPDSENDPYKLRGHEVTDFYEEIEFNKGNPRWAETAGIVCEAIHDKEKEDAKAAKKEAKMAKKRN